MDRLAVLSIRLFRLMKTRYPAFAMLPTSPAATRKSRSTSVSLADTAYARLKEEIFDFRLAPGDRFSETSTAERLQISRTPVREALFRLQQEGYLQVHFRNGWSVLPLDFEQFENFYDLRIILETAAVRRLCETERRPDEPAQQVLDGLRALWMVPVADRLTDGLVVARHDEAFHIALVEAVGNAELSRVHRDVTERIRIIRRLDFTRAPRIEKTYDEHGLILDAIQARRTDEALLRLRTHIEASKAEVREITLHRLFLARQAATVAPAVAEGSAADAGAAPASGPQKRSSSRK
jgi:DNA-binding GntR family transcriptional regulator